MTRWYFGTISRVPFRNDEGAGTSEKSARWALGSGRPRPRPSSLRLKLSHLRCLVIVGIILVARESRDQVRVDEVLLGLNIEVQVNGVPLGVFGFLGGSGCRVGLQDLLFIVRVSTKMSKRVASKVRGTIMQKWVFEFVLLAARTNGVLMEA